MALLGSFINIINYKTPENTANQNAHNYILTLTLKPTPATHLYIKTVQSKQLSQQKKRINYLPSFLKVFKYIVKTEMSAGLTPLILEA